MEKRIVKRHSANTWGRAPMACWLMQVLVASLVILSMQGCSKGDPADTTEPPQQIEQQKELEELRGYIRKHGRNDPPKEVNFKDPSVRWVSEAGATGKDSNTHGRVVLAVIFDTHGGAPILPKTFQCIANRDMSVGNKVIASGTNLATQELGLWEMIDDKGAIWVIDQVEGERNATEEYVSPGAISISVRVTNEYSYQCGWNTLRLVVQSKAQGLAIAENNVERGGKSQIMQGGKNQQLKITHNTGRLTDWVWFEDPEITVLSVKRDISGTLLTVTLDASHNAQVADHEFTIGVKETGEVKARGTYFMGFSDYSD